LETGANQTYNNFNNFKQDTGNNIIMCGQNLSDSGAEAGFNGLIAKADKNGNLLWFHEFRVPTGITPDYAWNFLYDMALLPNGDILAAGSWEYFSGISPLYFEQLAWIIRVNKDGCLDDGNCGITEIDNPLAQPPNQHQSLAIRLFPNPSNGIFTVNTEQPPPLFSELNIYSSVGQRLLKKVLYNQQTLINMVNASDGIYFYNVTCNGFVITGGTFEIQK
jgi:hypothetical protein